jgi:Domain of unknown function (DUF4335)
MRIEAQFIPIASHSPLVDIIRSDLLNLRKITAMTIRRQYSLPNCTLILDGLSDGNPTTGIADPRPVMSSLYNAECHFVGCEQPLFGGKDFLTSLVGTVSSYTQELLSGVSHPAPASNDNSLVSLTRGNRDDIHTLNTNPNPKETGSTGLLTDGKPTEIQLSTVQLFDLVEAIDRFLADNRTLPDLKVPLKPATRALAKPMSAQATSAGVGVASLLVASLIGYAIPTPKVTAPKFVDGSAPIVAPKDASTTPKAAPPIVIPSPKPSPTPSPSPSTSPASTSKGNKLVDGTQLGFLDRKLRRDLDRNWENRRQLKQSGTFKVSIDPEGEIVGYQPIEGTTDPKVADLTPLPKLVRKTPDPNGTSGDFRVVFTAGGVLQISPWDGRKRGTSLGKEIADPKMEKILADNLQAKLEQEVATDKSTYPKNVKYRVGVNQTGDIVDYEPAEAGAYDAESKTPLPKLVKFSPLAATSEEPLARYVVTFQRDGKVLVVK